MKLIDKNGDFLKRTALNEKLGSNLSYMTYNSLASSTPKEWKSQVKGKSLDVTDRLTDDTRLKCNNTLVLLVKIT